MSGVDSEVDMESESKKMEAQGYLNTLYFLGDNSNPNALIPQLKKIVDDEKLDPTAGQIQLRKLFLDNSDKIEKISDLFNFLRSYKKTDARMKHDLSNIAASVEGFLSVYLYSAQNGTDMDLGLLKKVLSRWGRYAVGTEDILLRVVSEKEISQEYQHGLDLDIIKSSMRYFSIDELNNIKSFSKEPGSAYSEIINKNIDLSVLENWDKLVAELGDRKIGGNSGVVGNFLLNALRNSIKDRILANNIKLTAEIKGDVFVLRVEDDGKGIEKKYLKPEYLEVDSVTGEEKSIYIFGEGTSGTNSTGIGLSNLDNRIASIGGELYLSSKSNIDGMVRFQAGGTDEDRDEIHFDENLEHGTVFEIRLPITKEK